MEVTERTTSGVVLPLNVWTQVRSDDARKLVGIDLTMVYRFQMDAGRGEIILFFKDGTSLPITGTEIVEITYSTLCKTFKIDEMSMRYGS